MANVSKHVIKRNNGDADVLCDGGVMLMATWRNNQASSSGSINNEEMASMYEMKAAYTAAMKSAPASMKIKRISSAKKKK